MSEFRTAIARTLGHQDYAVTDLDEYDPLAQAVLDTPEMQAIRRALGARALSQLNLTWRGYSAHDRNVATMLRSWDLPESVIAWILEDPDAEA